MVIFDLDFLKAWLKQNSYLHFCGTFKITIIVCVSPRKHCSKITLTMNTNTFFHTLQNGVGHPFTNSYTHLVRCHVGCLAGSNLVLSEDPRGANTLLYSVTWGAGLSLHFRLGMGRAGPPSRQQCYDRPELCHRVCVCVYDLQWWANFVMAAGGKIGDGWWWLGGGDMEGSGVMGHIARCWRILLFVAFN